MLQKKIAAIIVPIQRKCSKCGKLVTIKPENNITKCICGEIIHEEAKFTAGDSESEQTNSE